MYQRTICTRLYKELILASFSCSLKNTKTTPVFVRPKTLNENDQLDLRPSHVKNCTRYATHTTIPTYRTLLDQTSVHRRQRNRLILCNNPPQFTTKQRGVSESESQSNFEQFRGRVGRFTDFPHINKVNSKRISPERCNREPLHQVYLKYGTFFLEKLRNIHFNKNTNDENANLEISEKKSHS